MRRALAAGAAMTAVWLAPVASAESVVLPERPGRPGVVFIDDPAIVDPHPMPAESFSRAADRVIGLHFTTGTPECYGVFATVAETAETVTVELLSGTRPDAVDRACIMIAVAGTLDVTLDNPLGDRQVVSVY